MKIPLWHLLTVYCTQDKVIAKEKKKRTITINKFFAQIF